MIKVLDIKIAFASAYFPTEAIARPFQKVAARFATAGIIIMEPLVPRVALDHLFMLNRSTRVLLKEWRGRKSL